MPGPEKRFQNRIVKQLRAIGGEWVETPRSRFAKSGTPDVIGCISGFTFALEFKDPNGKYTVTETQRSTLDRWIAAGAIVAVVDSQEVADTVIQAAYIVNIGSEKEKGLELKAIR